MRGALKSIEWVGFDADDTLWPNEPFFRDTQERFARLLCPYHAPEWIQERLYQTEKRNLGYFGYGVKGFTLSMIETAIELTEGRIRGEEIAQILTLARQMLSQPVEPLEHVPAVLSRLSQTHRLLLVTKGDLFEQEGKIARSGLSRFFDRIEIVSEKDESAYCRILRQHQIEPRAFLMVGNSLKSDVLPVLSLGGQAVHIPCEVTWRHERIEPGQLDGQHFYRLEHMGQLPDLLSV